MNTLSLKEWNTIAIKIAPIWADVAASCGYNAEQIRSNKFEGAPPKEHSKEFVGRCYSGCLSKSTFLDAVISAEKLNEKDTSISAEVSGILFGSSDSAYNLPVLTTPVVPQPVVVQSPPPQPVVVHSPPPKVEAPIPVKAPVAAPFVTSKEQTMKTFKEDGQWTSAVFKCFEEDVAHKLADMAAEFELSERDIKNSIGPWATPNDCGSNLVDRIRRECPDLDTFKTRMRNAAKACHYNHLVSKYNL